MNNNWKKKWYLKKEEEKETTEKHYIYFYVLEGFDFCFYMKRDFVLCYVIPAN